jgi:hypothetical protein
VGHCEVELYGFVTGTNYSIGIGIYFDGDFYTACVFKGTMSDQSYTAICPFDLKGLQPNLPHSVFAHFAIYLWLRSYIESVDVFSIPVKVFVSS